MKNACRALRTMTREDFKRFMHDVDKYLPGKASKFWGCVKWAGSVRKKTSGQVTIRDSHG